MPTENRSSNTEMVSELLPCPFCGKKDFLIERLDSDASVVICQGLTGPHEACLARGPVGVVQDEGEEQPGRDKAVELWNARAEQHQGEPVGWQFYQDGKWWNGDDRIKDHRKNTEDAGYPVRNVSAHADPGEAQRQRSRADTNALNHKHAKNALGDIKAFVGRLVAGSNGQASIATGYLADIADFIDRRTIGDPVHIGDVNALRLDLQEARRNEFNASAEVERLREALAECKSARAEHEAQVAADFKHIDDLLAKLAKWGLLLGEIADHCNGCVMPTEQLLRDWGSSIDAALSASAEPSTHAWTCQPCKIEQPTNRPCDVCGAATELKI